MKRKAQTQADNNDRSIIRRAAAHLDTAHSVIRRAAARLGTATASTNQVDLEEVAMQHIFRLSLEQQIRVHNRVGMEIANSLLANELSVGNKEEVVGLLDLPQDARLRMLDFVDEQRDLGEYACVSKQCLADTNHPSLEQLVRWARIIVPPETEVVNIFAALKRAHENSVFKHIHGLLIDFTSGRKCDNLHATLRDVKPVLNSMQRLYRVTHLELKAPVPRSRNASPSRPYIKYCVPKFLSKFLPNLKSVTIDSDSGSSTASTFALKCKTLESFRWYHSFGHLRLSGFDFKKCECLKHLSLDGCVFFDASNPPFLDHVRKIIEEVSVPHIRKLRYSYINYRYFIEPIPAEWIREFIRKAPRLRRFRTSYCVLSPIQIAQARLDRPDVTFIVTKPGEEGNRKW